MAVVVPSGQNTQLVGLPPLSDETYRKLEQTAAIVYDRYKQRLSGDATEDAEG